LESVSEENLFHSIRFASFESFLIWKGQGFLENSQDELRKKLENTIAELIETPFPSGSKKLKGSRNSYRLRVGDYRFHDSFL
jgi:hypothetical protein